MPLVKKRNQGRHYFLGGKEVILFLDMLNLGKWDDVQIFGNLVLGFMRFVVCQTKSDV